MDQKHRVLVIGLDGATFDLLRPWAETGKLPTFSRILQEGVSGNLQSTVRPISPTAWSSFMTGKNPGKHGVFGFLRSREGQYSTDIINSSDVRAEAFWEVASRHGRRVAVINVPFTYPPREVNGALISGMLTPSVKSGFTYPPELADALLDNIGTYRIEPGRGLPGGNDLTERKRTFLSDLQLTTEKRTQATLYVMEEYAWDLFVVAFVGPDRVQHRFWADMDEAHPRHDPGAPPEFRNAILEHYQQLDRSIARILAAIPQNTTVLFASDHGFKGIEEALFINRILVDLGLLKLRSDASTTLRDRLWPLVSAAWQFAPLQKALRRVIPSSMLRRGGTVRKVIRTAFYDMVDWSRTKAYFDDNRGIRINVQGREPNGIVAPGREYKEIRDYIAEELLAVSHPENGCKVISQVFRREDVYSGEYVADAPDLIPLQQFSGGYSENVTLGGGNPTGFKQLVRSSLVSADHTFEGVFMSIGPHVRRGRRTDHARIIDVAPTVLYLLGLPVPADMDGQILADVLQEGTIEHNPPVFEETAGFQYSEQQVYTEEESRAMRDRLRELGYLE